MTNDVLRLKGRLGTGTAQQPGPPTLPAHTTVTLPDVLERCGQLEEIRTLWRERNIPVPPLIEVHYIQVVAKSNRIRALLDDSGHGANGSIVGAAFEPVHGRPCHVITHCVPMRVLDATIARLDGCAGILHRMGGTITAEALGSITAEGLPATARASRISKTAFAQTIRDVHYVRRFATKHTAPAEDDTTSMLVTLYDVHTDPLTLLNTLGVDVIGTNFIDPTTVLLTPDQYETLRRSAPYLISMSLRDPFELAFEDTGGERRERLGIPDPGNEPVIGVIDTRFDTSVYFSRWVDYHDEIDPVLDADGPDPADLRHGTEVTSLIVDGPSLNPGRDDGCGRFRVRHFAVAKAGRSSTVTILKDIERIVEANHRDIRVWNLSLGSVLEAPDKFISPVGALLDELQNRYDVVFIVAGTNDDGRAHPGNPRRIGSPADSINSIVVNSTTSDGRPASYTRVGPVLEFFRKPDIACFGGDRNDPVAVYSPHGIALGQGTSFAAPWIARKMAYLIEVMGLSRQAAKALLIDSATGWDQDRDDRTRIGYGIVPRRIEDILTTRSDEIRFLIEGTAATFETYNYRIPVPQSQDRYNYMARATLCYFPHCHRNQGVDYTDTELDLHFGRLDGKGIKSLNRNDQDDPTARTFEGSARRLFRKWDNVKQVSDVRKSRFRPRSTFGSDYWGFKIRRTERSDGPSGNAVRFGLVVTLREMSGRNRINDFINSCQLQTEPWIVERIDMNTSIDLYNKADVTIDFADDQNR